MNQAQKDITKSLRKNGAEFNLIVLPKLKGAVQIRVNYPKLVITIKDDGSLERYEGHPLAYAGFSEEYN